MTNKKQQAKLRIIALDGQIADHFYKINELKSMIEFHKKTLKRLKEEETK